jgi:hypothetical protein
MMLTVEQKIKLEGLYTDYLNTDEYKDFLDYVTELIPTLTKKNQTYITSLNNAWGVNQYGWKVFKSLDAFKKGIKILARSKDQEALDLIYAIAYSFSYFPEDLSEILFELFQLQFDRDVPCLTKKYLIAIYKLLTPYADKAEIIRYLTNLVVRNNPEFQEFIDSHLISQ